MLGNIMGNIMGGASGFMGADAIRDIEWSCTSGMQTGRGKSRLL